MESFRTDLLLIALMAMLAPMLAELPKSFRIPIVVAEIILGILVGPKALHLVEPSLVIDALAHLGLTFLIFLVGMEIDLGKIGRRPLTTGALGWTLSFAVAITCVLVFQALGLIRLPLLLAAGALTTTALGILVPILRDSGEIDTDFGKYVLASGTIGELGPMFLLSFMAIPGHDNFLHTLFVLSFLTITLIAAYLAIRVRSSPLLDRLARSMQSSGQLPVRICIAFQALLILLAGKFGLDVVMGALASGMVVGLASKGPGGDVLRSKLEAIGYGFLVPIFFVTAGIHFDLDALWASPLVPLQIMILLALLILVRSIPLFIYRRSLSPADIVPFILYSATGLPLIVVITEIALPLGLMSPERAAVLVSAGMISVLAFPILADRLRMRLGLSA
ncbi:MULTISPECIES: cation:proton antiporter [Methylococcus]|uniref:Cation:proton antiporter n=1 Tax=Methylococcus capsulatus TaxID=414 RepID=A0ABZ2F0Y4_METCP|nr:MULTISPECIES: cation:proton antiporter [Methylococcus]MDF9391364.1 cation:proton antiporter [Methylococcus capsulatus]